jgi:diguanylate cyclase (GGDEF)-like protein
MRLLWPSSGATWTSKSTHPTAPALGPIGGGGFPPEVVHFLGHDRIGSLSFSRRRPIPSTMGQSNPAEKVALAGAAVGALGLVACILNATVGLGSEALERVFENLIYPLLYGPAALICFARAWLLRSERLTWCAFGFAFVLWAAGWAYYGAELRHASSPPYPSLADACWLAFYPLSYVALVALVRARAPHFRRSMWIDGLLGGLALGAIAAAFLVEPIVESSGGDLRAVATSLAYPLGDLLLLCVVLTLLASTGWTPGRHWALIALALVIQIAADLVYLYLVATASWTSGTLLDAAWLLASLLVALFAWQCPGRATSASLDRWPVLLAPSILSLAALAVLVYGNFAEISGVASVLASAAIAAGIARAGFTFREKRRLRLAALRDSLTGLLNHGAFHAALEEEIERRQEPHVPFAVVLFDLDGFKRVNDLQGHSEGDRVLRGVANAIREACRATDLAARIGGDEFAMLLHDLDASTAAAVAERVRALIAERGSEVGVSYGVGEWPADGPSKEMVLVRADVALYAAKAETETPHPGADSSAQTVAVRWGDSDVSQRRLRRPRAQPAADEREHAQLRAYAAEVRYSHARELRRMRELEDSYIATVRTLAAAVAAKDEYTGNHIQRVHDLGMLLAGVVCPSDIHDAQLGYGFLLHDIGKLTIPDAVLTKPGKLTAEEWELVRAHPMEGVRILSSVPFLDRALDVVAHHHECWDGSGYPAGLAGEEIPIWARIFATVDALDAMTSDRPYRSALPLEVAVAEVVAGAGTQFDPACVEALVTLDRREIRRRLQGGSERLHRSGRARTIEV